MHFVINIVKQGGYSMNRFKDLNENMMIYFVGKNCNGCICSIKEFIRQDLFEKYKDCTLIAAPPNAPVYFR